MNAIQTSVISAALLFGGAGGAVAQASARSAAEPLVPELFDPQSQYRTFTVGELKDYVYPTAGIDNAFANRLVKVLAHFSPPRPTSTGIDHVKDRILFGTLGTSGKSNLATICASTFCQDFEDLQALGVLGADQQSQAASTPKQTQARTIHYGFVFSSKSEHEKFTATAKGNCTYTHACFLWIRGTLKYSTINVEHGLQKGEFGLAYVEVTDFRLYNGDTSQQSVDGANTLNALYYMYKFSKPVLKVLDAVSK